MAVRPIDVARTHQAMPYRIGHVAWLRHAAAKAIAGSRNSKRGPDRPVGGKHRRSIIRFAGRQPHDMPWIAAIHRRLAADRRDIVADSHSNPRDGKPRNQQLPRPPLA
ncbi:hypothetical protein [Rubripirellula lacrimiformis]|uniref:hypothetical protein n=1 Tax=Rubripirellula lacrimiformis TaxID=1930273 RepID=UPI00119D6024|nr:hypothetical protein [Rubripirellula lacrimiformis]